MFAGSRNQTSKSEKTLLRIAVLNLSLWADHEQNDHGQNMIFDWKTMIFALNIDWNWFNMDFLRAMKAMDKDGLGINASF